jgi:hypothetical protein
MLHNTSTNITTMRQFTPLILLTLVLACNEEENKGPDCKFSRIAQAGSVTKLPVNYYEGDTVVRVGDVYEGYRLVFNKQKRLIRREEPVVNPYYRSLLEYNAIGQVTSLKWYSKQGNNWEYDGRLIFTYNKGRVINLKVETGATQNGSVDDHQITWQGNDIQSIEHRLNGQPRCTTQFSYENAIPNPMRHFSYFYFVDGDANYLYYKLPFYFSEHLVTKQDGTCSPSPPRLFDYTFTSSGLIESMSARVGSSTGTLWEYEYECK